MLISLNWLKDYVDINCTPEILADKLVRAGFEVEEIRRLSDNCKNVVVGRVDSLSKHSDADKLQICEINIGGEILQIVTGANNIRIGDLVPVAKDGSDLPCGTHIKSGKLRGVLSSGMLCSGEELKLSEADYKGASINGIMILKEDYPLGTDMNVVLGNDDIVLDIGVTSNRPDCNSVLGIAREVATVLGLEMKKPKIEYKTSDIYINDYLKVNVLNKSLCPRYMAGLVKDIVIKESPKYIKNRLKSVGIRSINNIVDITNYVLTEIGQPMHAFDYNLVQGGEINVRNAKDGEEILALDNKKYILDSTMLTISDKFKPSAIAGIMGGQNSAIKAETNSIVLESARFLRENIRRSSRKLNLKSDSSARYERGIDFESQVLGLKRALTLIYQTNSGIICNGILDEISEDLAPKIITAKIEKINNILGINVPEKDISEILNSLQIESTILNGIITCKIPLFREDIENANDLAEEVIRLYGYDKITCTLIDKGRQTQGGKSLEQNNVDAIKNILIGEGAYEIFTYSFTSPKMKDKLLLEDGSVLKNTITLLNPLGEDLSIMRSNLTHSVLEVIAKNISRGSKAGRFFEFANIYLPKKLPLDELPNEVQHLVFGAYGKESFYSIKGIIENIILYFGLTESYIRSNRSYLHPGISAEIMIGETSVGFVGEIHPTVASNYDIKEKVYVAEIDMNLLNKMFDNTFVFKSIPKYPVVERDIAVLIKEEVSVAQILNCINQAGGKILTSSNVFDIYRGKGVDVGNKSVAINLIFQMADKTLTDEEVSLKTEKILKRLENDFGAKLR